MFAGIAWCFTAPLANGQSDDLITAAAQGDLTAVNALLKAGADVNDTKSTALGTTTALMAASSNGHLATVPALVAAKADVNATGRASLKDGITALALASRNGHLNVVKVLLAANADVNAGSIPPLYYATAAGNADIVGALLAAKPKLDWQDPLLGTTTLMLALAPLNNVVPNQLPRSGRWDIAQLLIEAGANVNVTSRAGVTALMLVAQEDSPRSLAMVKSLLAAHADVNGGCDCIGAFVLGGPAEPAYARATRHTALGAAASTGSVDVVQALLDANSQRAANPSVAVNAKQAGGNTALTIAAAKGRAGVVRLLLAAKADVSAADDNGKTALMLASENNHPEVAQLLR
jgi:serine/threonine-protein phosphatase 6 regulatory ankyrin repeat subunit B